METPDAAPDGNALLTLVTMKMPFGKYKGEKLANVPADWLLWAYHEIPHLDGNLKEYIKENMQPIKQEK